MTRVRRYLYRQFRFSPRELAGVLVLGTLAGLIVNEATEPAPRAVSYMGQEDKASHCRTTLALLDGVQDASTDMPSDKRREIVREHYPECL